MSNNTEYRELPPQWITEVWHMYVLHNMILGHICAIVRIELSVERRDLRHLAAIS